MSILALLESRWAFNRSDYCLNSSLQTRGSRPYAGRHADGGAERVDYTDSKIYQLKVDAFQWRLVSDVVAHGQSKYRCFHTLNTFIFVSKSSNL